MADAEPCDSLPAASPEDLSGVQVMDSFEPLVATSSSVSCVQVLDSFEPLVSTASVSPCVQVLDSSEPLVPMSPVLSHPSSNLSGNYSFMILYIFHYALQIRR